MFLVDHGLEVVQHHAHAFFAPDASLGDILSEELILDRRIRQGLGYQVSEIDHLHAVLAEQMTEGIVFLLGDFQVRDIVEQQPFDILGHQVFQLPARPVEQHPLEGADLAADFDGRQTHTITPFISRANLPLPSKIYV